MTQMPASMHYIAVIRGEWEALATLYLIEEGTPTPTGNTLYEAAWHAAYDLWNESRIQRVRLLCSVRGEAMLGAIDAFEAYGVEVSLICPRDGNAFGGVQRQSPVERFKNAVRDAIVVNASELEGDNERRIKLGLVANMVGLESRNKAPE